MTLSVTNVSGLLDIYGTADEFPPPFRPPNGSLYFSSDDGRLLRYETDTEEWLDITALGIGSATYNVKAAGAKGDGVTDDTAVIQALLSSVPASSTIYFPTGTYKISASLDFGAKVLHLVGDSQGRAAEGVLTGGSIISGSINGPLVKTGTGLNGGIVIEKLGFRNTHASGTGLRVTGLCMALRDLSIGAFIGIDAKLNTFTLLIENVLIHPSPTPFAVGSVGILASSHTSIHGCDIVNFENAVRAWGTTVDIRGCRIEVNVVGFNLGIDDTGAGSILSRSVIDGNSFEANDTAIWIQNVTSTAIQGFGIQGSVNAPSGQSLYGIRVLTGSFTGVSIASGVIAGTFSTSGLSVVAGSANNVTFSGVNVANTFGGGSTVWSINNPHLFAFFNTNWAALALPIVSPAQLTADQNDYSPSLEANWRLSSNAAWTITGIANGVSGRELKILNVGSQNILLGNQNAGSAVGNRIITGTGGDVTLAADASATLLYDATTVRWRKVS